MAELVDGSQPRGAPATTIVFEEGADEANATVSARARPHPPGRRRVPHLRPTTANTARASSAMAGRLKCRVATGVARNSGRATEIYLGSGVPEICSGDAKRARVGGAGQPEPENASVPFSMARGKRWTSRSNGEPTSPDSLMDQTTTMAWATHHGPQTDMRTRPRRRIAALCLASSSRVA